MTGRHRCDVCGNRVAVRKDGRLRRHGWKWHPEQGYCRGSEMTVAPDGDAGETPQDGMYSTREVYVLAGVTPRQIHYWTSTGVVVPSVRGKGPGYPHRWSECDLLLVRVAAALVGGGLSLDATREALAALRTALDDGADSALFVVRCREHGVGILTEDHLPTYVASHAHGPIAVLLVDRDSVTTGVPLAASGC